ncbi:hypothetical protein TKK_0011586 [Trichogramma kaykai]
MYTTVQLSKLSMTIHPLPNHPSIQWTIITLLLLPVALLLMIFMLHYWINLKILIDFLVLTRKMIKMIKKYLGDSKIYFHNDSVQVGNEKYPKTDGLLELLYKKHLNRDKYRTQDLDTYKNILDYTNAVRKGHSSTGELRRSNSTKLNDIILPMFHKRGGSLLLPRFKVARVNSHKDYVHWDDPNELVDRLRLLIAETSAGNNNHTNEINSIVEELREAGYIY